MSIAPCVQDFLAERQIGYALSLHPRSETSRQTARLAHVPPHSLAKAVVLKDESGYLVAAVPSSDRISGGRLAQALHRDGLRLATEWELALLFGDCRLGAIPPLGAPYGLPLVVDEALDDESEVCFEAGDHEHLVHLSHAEFLRATVEAPRAHFTRPLRNGDAS